MPTTSIIGRRDGAVSSSQIRRASGDQLERDAGSDGMGRFGELGRLYEDRGQVWAEAVKVRQLDRKLSRVADRAGDVQTKLEHVKLYPPYPVNEPRRAEAIREFNGLAAEVRRMAASGETPAVDLTLLSPTASTSDAEQAAASAGELHRRFAAQRAALANGAESQGTSDAESESAAVGSSLGTAGLVGISRQVTDLLIQIA